MANKDLFAQAIADAKKLKEISMANAKQAIEEAFAPRIQEMFRMKLSEMDDSTAEVVDDEVDDDIVTEDDYTEDGMENMEEGIEDDYTKGRQHNVQDPLDEMTLEEILAELELEEDYGYNGPMSDEKSTFKTVSKDDTAYGKGVRDIKGTEGGLPYMKEGKDDDTDDEAAEESTGGETVGEVDLDTLVSKVADAVINALNAKEGGAEDMEAGEEEKDGAISLDEILAELQEADEMEENIFRKMGSGLQAITIGGGKVGVNDAPVKDKYAAIEACKKEGVKGTTAIANCAEKKLNISTPSHTAGAAFGVKEGEVDENIFRKMGSGLQAAVIGGGKVGVNDAPIKDKYAAIEACKKEGVKGITNIANCAEKKLNISTPSHTAGAAFGVKEGNSVELYEAINTIHVLKSQLNEINLLNAKLLYVNKIFKAKSLTEAQKVRVVSAFDRAATIREAKNIYATLSESLQSPSIKKAPLKESLGFASKPIGSAPARPIVEADAYVHRMQQLAGLRQPNI